MSMGFLQPGPGSLLSFHEISNFSSIFFQFFSPTFPSFVCIFFWKKISFCLIQSILIRFHAESLIKTKYLGWWLIRWKSLGKCMNDSHLQKLHKEQSKVRWLICGWALGLCRPLKLTCHSAPKQLSNSWSTFSHRQIEGESHHLSPLIYAIEFGIIPFDFTFQKRQLYF